MPSGKPWRRKRRKPFNEKRLEAGAEAGHRGAGQRGEATGNGASAGTGRPAARLRLRHECRQTGACREQSGPRAGFARTASGPNRARRICAAGNGVTSGNRPAATPCLRSPRRAKSNRWPLPPTAHGWRSASRTRTAFLCGTFGRGRRWLTLRPGQSRCMSPFRRSSLCWRSVPMVMAQGSPKPLCAFGMSQRVK